MKQKRHQCIRELLSTKLIANQDELRVLLSSQGHHVTQATLSRDINELGLSKGPTGYVLPVQPDEVHASPGVAEVLKSFGLEARLALNLLVLVTITGGAQPVAAGIDYEDWPEVMGTIAGDDTVLIICPDDRSAKTLKTRIDDYIG
jgi:transcriptional regulator of arginine metabolism